MCIPIDADACAAVPALAADEGPSTTSPSLMQLSHLAPTDWPKANLTEGHECFACLLAIPGSSHAAIKIVALSGRSAVAAEANRWMLLEHEVATIHGTNRSRIGRRRRVNRRDRWDRSRCLFFVRHQGRTRIASLVRRSFVGPAIIECLPELAVGRPLPY